MTISLIVPIYNKAPFLRRCLDSIKNQTEAFDEVILIDDGSTDGSDRIMVEYLADMMGLGWSVISQKNQGVSKARNAGVEYATSDFIVFLDADDELLPDACEIMHEAIKQYPHENFMQFNHLRHYAKINKTVKKYDNRSGVFNAENLQTCQCWWGVWNKVIKREALRFDFRPELRKFGEDGVFILEHILYGARIRTIDKETVIHHFEDLNSLTKSKGKAELLVLDRVHRGILAKRCDLDEPWANIKLIVDCIENCQTNPHYKALRGRRDV